MPQDATVEGLSVMDEISPVVTTDATAASERVLSAGVENTIESTVEGQIQEQTDIGQAAVTAAKEEAERVALEGSAAVDALEK